MIVSNFRSDDALEMIAFMPHGGQFCVPTTSIRGRSPFKPLPQTSPDMLGLMNPRGFVIPIVDSPVERRMPQANKNGRSAVVVTQIDGKTVGAMIDRVSDVLMVSGKDLLPLPTLATEVSGACTQGIFACGEEMTCFLDIHAVFAPSEASVLGMAA